MHKNDRKLRKVTALFKYASFYKLDSAMLETVLARLMAPSVNVEDIVVSNFSLLANKVSKYIHRRTKEYQRNSQSHS